jgi:hypothetical protein
MRILGCDVMVVIVDVHLRLRYHAVVGSDTGSVPQLIPGYLVSVSFMTFSVYPFEVLC